MTIAKSTIAKSSKAVRPSNTPFLRLDANTGWRFSQAGSQIIEDPVSHKLRLGKPGDFPISPLESFGTFGGMTLPRGVSVSLDGRVLLADPGNNRIIYYDPLSAKKILNNNTTPHECSEGVPVPFKHLWKPVKDSAGEESSSEEPSIEESCLSPEQHEIFSHPVKLGPYQLSDPQDVIFSPNGEVVIADSGNSRVLVFSWPEFRLRQEIKFANGYPISLAYDTRRHLHVADSNAGQVFRFNRLWQRDADFDGGKDTLESPIAIAIDSQDNVMVLDGELSQIFLLDANGKISGIDPLSMDVFSRDYLVPPFQLVDDQLKYPQIQKPDCEALNLTGISVDSLGHLRGTSLALIALPRNIRLPLDGAYISEQFDNEVSGSQWHRVVMDVQLPATGRILLQTHTSDRSVDESELDSIEWSQPMIISTEQSSELPEILIQSGAGRYLRLKIELMGDGYLTPEINSILIYGPRDSALKYLPPPFHQDPESAFFLDRFLSYFDTVQEEVKFLIRDFTRYLDPAGVPAGEFLDWLGSWFDWKFLAQWPTDLRREMIQNSVKYFKLRGTLSGLKQMLQWHTGLTGEQPQIIEHYRLRNYTQLQKLTPSIDHVIQTQELYVGEKPFTLPADKITHWFTVVLPVSVVPDAEAKQTITALIEAQKPAHTAFQLCIFNPGVRVGKQSSIGIDTWLGNYPQEPLGNMNLGQSSRVKSAGSRGHKIGHKLLQ